MFQVLFFFHNFLQNSLQNGFNLFFYKFTKIKIEIFECPKSIRNYEKNNAWNIRQLVGESFVPANQLTSVLLSDFKFVLMCSDLKTRGSSALKKNKWDAHCTLYSPYPQHLLPKMRQNTACRHAGSGAGAYGGGLPAHCVVLEFEWQLFLCSSMY